PAHAVSTAHEHSWSDRQPLLVCVLEVLALAVVLPAAAYWFGKPAVLQSLSPLLILLPLVFGLRYGFYAGVAAALALSAILLLASMHRPLAMPGFPKMLAVVLLIGGAAAGQFRDRWAAHLRSSHAQASYHAARFAQFSSGYATLKLSHVQLEQQLANGAISLRSALQTLRRNLPMQPESAQLPLMGMARQMLDVLAEAGNFHAAALYGVTDQGLAAEVPLAVLGRMPSLPADSPMLREALRCGQVVSLQASELAGSPMPPQESEPCQHPGKRAQRQAFDPHAVLEDGELLAVVPLSDSRGRIHAVICVGAMPFIAIHQRTFEVVALLARQIGEMLTSHVVVADGNGGTAMLRKHLARSLQSARSAGVQACIAVFRSGTAPAGETRAAGVGNIGSVGNPGSSSSSSSSEQAEQWIRQCLDTGRVTDQSWLCRDRRGAAVIVKFMPMVAHADAQAHVQRLLVQAGQGAALQAQAWEISATQSVDDVLARIGTICELRFADQPRGSQPASMAWRVALGSLRYAAIGPRWSAKGPRQAWRGLDPRSGRAAIDKAGSATAGAGQGAGMVVGRGASMERTAAAAPLAGLANSLRMRYCTDMLTHLGRASRHSAEASQRQIESERAS
ncbi:MAG: hypothetical protein ACRYGK_18275, partial [Janthinobacterium lividum]